MCRPTLKPGDTLWGEVVVLRVGACLAGWVFAIAAVAVVVARHKERHLDERILVPADLVGEELQHHLVTPLLHLRGHRRRLLELALVRTPS